MINIIKRKIKTIINNPVSVPIKLLNKLSPLIPDRAYLKMLFPLEVGYKLNLENPQTFNEKLQWLKLNFRKPELTRMVDKYEAKGFATEKIGEEYIVKNYGVWDSFDDIDFDSLPNQFVLKTTHDQGGVVICKDKKVFDYDKAKRKLSKHLKFEHYYLTREWPYKNVKPRILAEELLVDNTKGDIWDYKFYCFNGEPNLLFVSSGRNGLNIVSAGIITLSIFGYKFFLENEYLVQRLASIATGDSSGRDVIYANLFKAWLNSESYVNLLLGHGFGSSIFLSGTGNWAHNDWLELLTNFGLLGVIIYLTLFVTAGKMALGTQWNIDKRIVLISILGIWFFTTIVSMNYTSTNSIFQTIMLAYLFGNERKFI